MTTLTEIVERIVHRIIAVAPCLSSSSLYLFLTQRLQISWSTSCTHHQQHPRRAWSNCKQIQPHGILVIVTVYVASYNTLDCNCHTSNYYNNLWWLAASYKLSNQNFCVYLSCTVKVLG